MKNYFEIWAFDLMSWAKKTESNSHEQLAQVFCWWIGLCCITDQ